MVCFGLFTDKCVITENAIISELLNEFETDQNLFNLLGILSVF